MRGGMGTASVTVNGITVGAIIACNAVGDIHGTYMHQSPQGSLLLVLEASDAEIDQKYKLNQVVAPVLPE